MPHATAPQLLGSVSYYGYPSLSEAFFALSETSQAIYMTLLVNHRRQGQESPIVLVDIDAFASALNLRSMDIYSAIGEITNCVIVQREAIGQLMTTMAVSIQEVWDTDGFPTAITLMFPAIPGQPDLMEQADDLSLGDVDTNAGV